MIIIRNTLSLSLANICICVSVCVLFNIYTLLFKSLGSVQFLLINFFKKLILLFIYLNWSKVTMKTFTMLQDSISNKCCSFELSIHQSIHTKKRLVSTKISAY